MTRVASLSRSIAAGIFFLERVCSFSLNREERKIVRSLIGRRFITNPQINGNEANREFEAHECGMSYDVRIAKMKCGMYDDETSFWKEEKGELVSADYSSRDAELSYHMYDRDVMYSKCARYLLGILSE